MTYCIQCLNRDQQIAVLRRRITALGDSDMTEKMSAQDGGALSDEVLRKMAGGVVGVVSLHQRQQAASELLALRATYAALVAAVREVVTAEHAYLADPNVEPYPTKLAAKARMARARTALRALVAAQGQGGGE